MPAVFAATAMLAMASDGVNGVQHRAHITRVCPAAKHTRAGNSTHLLGERTDPRSIRI